MNLYNRKFNEFLNEQKKKLPWMKPKNQINFALVLLLFLVGGIILYDAIRMKTALQSTTSTDNFGIIQYNYPHPYVYEPDKENATEINVDESDESTQQESNITCEYIDILQEYVDEPAATDDIQEIIGYQNNKVGLYIYAEVSEYTDLAAELANSNGGEWGYALIPYNVKDYNSGKWGRVFENLRRQKLIPIIQLWDLDLDDIEERNEQIIKSAEFLNTLQWPIKQRYISAYNEMNDAKFWKGNVDPEEYAEILDLTIRAFKSQNENFFLMNGAFNASARTGGEYLDAETYMIRMDREIPGIFEDLDGWASHPYPQPNFSGSPQGTGRDSIRAYEWELEVLEKNFGVTGLPVFITETGWARRESEALDRGQSVPFRLNQYQVADNIRYAFEEVWMKDDKVVAVTPFTVRYKPPHDHFSWITQSGNPYPQFLAVKDIRKVQGRPPVVTYHKSKILECK